MKQVYRETKQINKTNLTVSAFMPDTGTELENFMPSLVHVYEWDPESEEPILDNWYTLKSHVIQSQVIRMAITSFDRHEKEILDKIKREIDNV